jgi:hypothetical protein
LAIARGTATVPGYDLPTAGAGYELLFSRGVLTTGRGEVFRIGPAVLATEQVIPGLGAEFGLKNVSLDVNGTTLRLFSTPVPYKLKAELDKDVAKLKKDRAYFDQRLQTIKANPKTSITAQAAYQDLINVLKVSLPDGGTNEELGNKAGEVARAKQAELSNQIRELEAKYEALKSGWEQFTLQKHSLSIELYRLVDGIILEGKPAQGSKGIFVKTLIIGQPAGMPSQGAAGALPPETEKPPEKTE